MIPLNANLSDELLTLKGSNTRVVKRQKKSRELVGEQ
jgi:hypothetical protein